MLDQKLIHGGHQVLTWNVADAVVMIDPVHGRKIAKDKSVDRVDGLVALAMAIGLYNRELAPCCGATGPRGAPQARPPRHRL